MKKYGSFSLVLHCHLPYVLSHGRWPHGMDWLNEACAETYIPLLDTFYRLGEEGYSPKVTINITPVLAEQISHSDFISEFKQYLKNKIEVSREDERQFNSWGLSHLKMLARRWEEFYNQKLIYFQDKCQEDILGSFRGLQDEGHIEIITSCATHGYLPLLSKEGSIRTQIKQGVASYKRFFRRPPRGFWLPECGYRPAYKWRPPVGKRKTSYLRKGIEEFLGENDLNYFLVDTPLLKGGKSIGVYIHRFQALEVLWKDFQKQYRPRRQKRELSPYQAYLVNPQQNRRPVAVFARDPRTGIQVWSGKWGYPGDGWYLEFHKKQFPGGNRYWRVTGSKVGLGEKEEYYPQKAEERLRENAGHFKALIKSTLKEHYKRTGKEGIICAPFDAELFGHWWFEGPQWLYLVLKWIEEDPQIKLNTCSEFLNEHFPAEVVSLPEGSWGQGGFHWIWLNQWTEWTWKYIYEAEEKMEQLLEKYANSNDSELQRLLKQLLRELLLLQSSDWQFLTSTWTARDYGEARVNEHYEDFNHLSRIIDEYAEKGVLDSGNREFLKFCEKKDDLFGDIKPDWFQG